jgi:hypothetical protein
MMLGLRIRSDLNERKGLRIPGCPASDLTWDCGGFWQRADAQHRRSAEAAAAATSRMTSLDSPVLGQAACLAGTKAGTTCRSGAVAA